MRNVVVGQVDCVVVFGDTEVLDGGDFVACDGEGAL